jgi:hypothetical protein
MILLNIPCRPDLTFYQMQVVLDGVTYTLVFRWNDRESSWYMDILSENEDPIVTSIKVVIGTYLGWRSRLGPPGRFLTFDTTNLDKAPDQADLGDRVQLYYVPVGEF